MRLRVMDVEGSPEEMLAIPELRDALGRIGGAPGVVSADDDEVTTSAVAKELQDFISARSGGRDRAVMVTRYAAEVLRWGATWELGRSVNSSDSHGRYFRLYAKGPRHFGAVSYVEPRKAKVTLRLLRADAKGFACATFRNVKKGTGYEVVVILDSDRAMQEALALTRKALDRLQ